MNKKWLTVTLAGVFALAGCSQNGKTEEKIYGQYLYNIFGTEAVVCLGDEATDAGMARAGETINEVASLLKEVEKSLSVEIETSCIARFNSASPGERIVIDQTTYEVLSIAMEMYELTGGAYNPSVGHLVDLWGFSPRFRDVDYQPEKPYDREMADGALALPSEDYIESFSALTNFQDVEFGEEGDSYYMVKPSSEVTIEGITYTMMLDLGGIGKGYVADLGAEYVKGKGYDSGYVSLGSSSISLLKSLKEEDGYCWNLGFTHPRPVIPGMNYIQSPVKDVSVSSSGDYENYYYVDDTRYCHIIDPFTARPIQTGVCTATVIGLPASYADALTTALLVMGTQQAVSFMQTTYPDVQYVIVKEGTALEIHTNLDSYTLLDQAIKVIKYE
ncbi:MAG: FAD:protein FMN transferase [Clostridia bacterium]|nr:FAD:protein FMN transferase [Clostridia bacterium]